MCYCIGGICIVLIIICVFFGGGVYILEMYVDNLEGLMV